jgi:beta-lactamase superfamily II metal-dependent hydrolase
LPWFKATPSNSSERYIAKLDIIDKKEYIVLKLSVLNVGHGDCIIVHFIDSNRTAMIDINTTNVYDDKTINELLEMYNYASYTRLLGKSEKADIKRTLQREGYDISLQDPLEFLSRRGFTNIFRFISTHPHMDHISGITKLKDELDITNIWINKNNYTQDMEELSDDQKQDWMSYKKFRDSDNEHEENIKIMRILENVHGSYYSEDGIEILSPDSELLNKGADNANLMSYVLLIKHRGRKIVLAGDAEEANWDFILRNHKEKIEDIDILKAAHHGRDSGYNKEALDVMKPNYVVVSVGKKPNSDASNKYRNYTDNVWSTRWKGNIEFTVYDDGIIDSDCQYDR